MTIFRQEAIGVLVEGDPLPAGLWWRHPDGSFTRCLGLVAGKGDRTWRDVIERIQDQTGSRLVYLAETDAPADG